MAAVLKAVPASPIADTIRTLTAIQTAAIAALPDAEKVVIELPHTSDADPSLRLVLTLKALTDPAETLFVLRRNLVEGVRFGAPNLRAGDHKRHIITANIEVSA